MEKISKMYRIFDRFFREKLGDIEQHHEAEAVLHCITLYYLHYYIRLKRTWEENSQAKHSLSFKSPKTLRTFVISNINSILILYQIFFKFIAF